MGMSARPFLNHFNVLFTQWKFGEEELRIHQCNVPSHGRKLYAVRAVGNFMSLFSRTCNPTRQRLAEPVTDSCKILLASTSSRRSPLRVNVSGFLTSENTPQQSRRAPKTNRTCFKTISSDCNEFSWDVCDVVNMK